jgi:hypothetical protein
MSCKYFLYVVCFRAAGLLLNCRSAGWSAATAVANALHCNAVSIELAAVLTTLLALLPPLLCAMLQEAAAKGAGEDFSAVQVTGTTGTTVVTAVGVRCAGGAAADHKMHHAA